jgi:glucuronokinase
VALAGNPSDGYGGAVLAVTLDEHRAQVTARAGGSRIDPPSALVEATVQRLARLDPRVSETEIRWRTSVPRGVGLGGSSAIVIATLRALCDCHSLRLAPDELAELALAVETDELGIVAGLQDRIAQAYEGLTFMDFSRADYERLDPGLLPPLLVAWRADAAGDSGVVHGDLRTRFEQGERVVVEGMAELAELAHLARAALLERGRDAFAESVDRSFDARARMLELDRRHVEMVELARAGGAAANYTGSGGAIVCVCEDEDHRTSLANALGAGGCATTALA